ncbi:proton-conducting transporter transmembrane domain-containing protein [Pseudodesulfovibrio karagichevae]|uniref:Proton-conducting transporter membrane subunit n=1 Tax=Pseudodesulfovibrio karagichevae TaxID=3239305 RepID=A0ABV4JWX8_9BACT
MSIAHTIFVACGALLIVGGELLALRAISNLKRLLIFSAIAECGYFLIGLGVGSTSGISGAALHLVYQFVIRSLVFLTAWRLASGKGSWALGSLRGSSRRMPLTTIMFGFGMFSFMGLSPFKGSISKFLVTYSAIENGNYLIAASATLGTIIAAVYILRVIQTICFEVSEEDTTPAKENMLSASGIIVFLLAGLTAAMTIHPEPLIHFCEDLALSMGTPETGSELPHFESPWPIQVIVPYLGGFAVYVVGKLLPKIRDFSAIAVAVGALAVIITEPQPNAFLFLGSTLFAFICTIVVIYSTGYLGEKPHANRYFFFLFLMYGSLVGVATAKDLGNFYLFWELMTWTSYLLVIHKQTAKALKAGYKYIVMCVSGATIMHYGILLWHSSAETFDIALLHSVAPSTIGWTGILIGLLFFIGLGVKAGLFPMHSWLPDAHPVAPSSISAPMSGILTKAGILGLIKFLPLFAAGTIPFVSPVSETVLPTLLMVAGGATLLFGEIMALRQDDIKRMLAYSTLAQLGEITLILSINTWLTTVGSLGHVVNHALMKDLLFLTAGAFIMRAGSQQVSQLAGLGRRMPITGACFAIGIVSIMGLPPFNGFMSKFLMLYSAVNEGFYTVAAIILAGSLIGAIYYGRLLKVLFFENSSTETVTESPASMLTAMIALASACVIFGLQPSLWITPTVQAATAIWGAASIVDIPNLTIAWPTPTLILVQGAATMLCLRRTRAMGIVAAAITTIAGGSLFLMPQQSAYGTAFVTVLLFSAALSFLYAAQYMDHSHRQWRFFATCLIMVCGLTGLALSNNLFHFFTFWEIMSSWPLFFAIIHEETSEAKREGTKYFLFNLAGASSLFLGVLLMGQAANSFAFSDIITALPNLPTSAWLTPVALMAVGFFMKGAMVPLRIDWQMHPASAPTPISGYISAVLLKSAPFGMLILCFVLGGSVLETAPMQQIMYIGAWIAGLTIFYAAYKAVTQSSIKGILIYSTVSQLGYILLGICLGTPLGLTGGLMHFVNHMAFKNLAFLCAGALIYKTHAHSLNELGGIGRRMPLTTLAFGVATMSAAGVPPFNGFTSKWLLYNELGGQGEILLLLLALSGSVLTLAYFFKFLHSAFLGHPSARHDNVTEVGPLMLIPMGILAAVCLVTGIFPGLLLAPIDTILQTLNLSPIPSSLSGVTDSAMRWDATLIGCMLLMALFMILGLLQLMGGRVRRTNMHMCGVTELTEEATNVTAENVYEAPLELVMQIRRAISAPFIKE